METFLLIVTIVSLVGAAGMSIVAWKLLSDSRARSAIRVATLQSLAFPEDDDDASPTSRFAAIDGDDIRPTEPAPHATPTFTEAAADDDDPEMWDVTIDPAPGLASTSTGAVASRMFEPRTAPAGAGLRLAALVPGRAQATLVDPRTTVTETIQLPLGYSQMRIVTDDVSDDTSDDAPDDAPDNVSMAHELKRKEKHDAWLREHLGELPYRYNWGVIESVFYHQHCGSEITVSYQSGHAGT